MHGPQLPQSNSDLLLSNCLGINLAISSIGNDDIAIALVVLHDGSMSNAKPNAVGWLP